MADIRPVPLEEEDGFASVLSVRSVEHVPDPEKVITEVVRLLDSGGTAIFVTPNRLTFGHPDEIIDPFHFVEFDAGELESLCGTGFAEVEIRDFRVGPLHGSSMTNGPHLTGCSASIR